MNLEDFEKLERQLNALNLENASLKSKNQQQREQIERLAARTQQLQVLANNQPIKLIRQQMDPLSITNSQYLLQNRIACQATQITFLERITQDKTLQMTQILKQVGDLELQCQEYKLQIQLNQQELKENEKKEERNKREAQGWRARIDRIAKDHQRALDEKEQLARRLREEQEKNYSVLLELAQQVTAIKEAVGQATQQKQPDLVTLETVARIQQEELRQRNEEIGMLKTANGGSGEGEQHLKNTIRHLRGQLSRYDTLIRHVTDKLKLAEQVVQRYTVSADKCKQELASIDRLNQRIAEQAHQQRILEEELRRQQEELDRQKREKMEFKKHLVNVLQENQCFHEFLFHTYGENFEEILQNQRELYQQRLKQRQHGQKWATVEELVEVNEHLRTRLKIA